jgi:hypothetical protein
LLPCTHFLQELEEAADMSAARHYNALMIEAQHLTQQVEAMLAASEQDPDMGY